ncbi:MAG: hypothetical protein ACR2NR_22640 [Solirubrobacteraceae bacterium]
MSKFTDHLWRDLVREHGPTLAHADRPEPGQPRRRPRVLAVSTLGLAGVGAALVLALSGSATPPAYAVTTNGDGSVTVQIDRTSSIVAANNKLAAMGIHEQFGIDMASGPAPVSGAVKCQPKPGESVSGPTVKVLVGKDGTEVIHPATGGNTGVGTFHLAACYVSNGTGYTGGTGNSGV